MEKADLRLTNGKGGLRVEARDLESGAGTGAP